MIINKLKIRISYADTDQMGIVYYARYFEYFERGRTELLRELGLPYSQMEKQGVSLPVIEAHCEYRKRIKYDEVIILKTYLNEPPKGRMRMNYEILNESEDEVLTEGYTIHSFINKQGKPVRPPQNFLQLITAHLK